MNKYIIDFKNLKKGDIVLSSGSGKGAKLIKFGTNSVYSHAMIYVHHILIQAIPEGGVFSKNPQRLIFDSLDDVKILRLVEPIDPEKMDKICDFTRTLVGTLYSKKEAVSVKVYGKKDISSKINKQFCSRLVAQAYKSEGIILVKNPDYCSPEDINKSDLLECVQGIARVASAEEIKFAQTSDPILENQRVTLAWLTKNRDLAKKSNFEIQSENDSIRFLCEYPIFDEKVCDYISDSGYLENYKSDYNINPYRYDPLLFEKAMLSTSITPSDFIKTEFDKEPGLVGHNIKNININKTNSEKIKLKYFLLHHNLYRNILEMAKERLNILLLASNKYDSSLCSPIFKIIRDIDNAIL